MTASQNGQFCRWLDTSQSASVALSRRRHEFREGVTAGRHPAAVGNDSGRFWAFEAVAVSAPHQTSGAPDRDFL